MNKKEEHYTTCEEAGFYCDKCQYKEANIWEKIKLAFHLMICSSCRKYSSQNRKLTQLLNEAKLQSLNPDERQELSKLLQQQISNKTKL